MADFKTALKAMSAGELKQDTVVKNMEKLLRKKPRLAQQMIVSLREAYSEDLIDAQVYASLKKRAEELGGITNESDSADASEATQFAGDMDDSTQILSDDDRAAIAEEARSATQIDITTGETTGTVDFDLSEPGSTTSDTWGDTGTNATGTEFGAPAAASPESIKIGPGSVLKERFKLLDVLGVGGMGTVYKAIDLLKEEARDRNPYVALKVLNEDFKQHPDAFIALQREASRQQKLAHPNIATVYDFDRTGSTVYITMELMEGTPLNVLIKKTVKAKGGLPFEEAWPYIEGLGKGLMYAHERSMVHSDFKPGNCFQLNSGVVKILDFGIARAVKNPMQGDAEKTLFDPGKLGALTPAYASTEMLEGEEPDPRDDIYALACVAYELLTGKHPFNKLPANTARDNNLVPAPIKSLKRKQLKGLMRGLAFEREERSKNVEEFLEEIEGASTWYKNPLVIGGGVALIAVLAGTPQIIGYMHDKQITQIIAGIEADPASFESLRSRLPTLSTDAEDPFDEVDQKRILDSARDAIQQGYYGKLIDSLVAGNDFPRAERELGELSALYPDSSFVNGVRARVEDKRNILMASLNDAYVLRIEEGRLLENGDDKGVAHVLEQIQKVSPNDPLLRDARLAAAFSNQAETAIENLEFDRAQALVEGGLAVTSRFAGDARKDVSLVNLSDKIRNAMDQATLSDQIAELQARIEAAAPGLKALPDFSGLGEDIAQLAQLDPQNPLVTDLRGRVQPLIREEIQRISSERDWASVDTVEDDYRPMLAALGLDNGLLQLSADRSAFNRKLDELRTALSTAISEDRMSGPDGAQGLLDSIEEAAGGTAYAAQARDGLARAYLDDARKARAGGDFGAARQHVAAAQQLKPDTEVSAALKAELARISAEQSAPTDADANRVAELEAAISAALADFDGNAEAAGSIVSDLDELSALSPDAASISSSRDTLTNAIASAARRTGESGEYEKAVDDVRLAMALLPGDARLTSALSELRAGAETALANEQKQAIETSRERVAALLADPQFDRQWDQSIQNELKQTAALLPAEDTWAQDTRNQLTSLYLERAEQMRSEQRFSEATAMLDRASTYSPDSPALASERQALASAEAEFKAARDAELQQAEIDGLKQSLTTQAKAREVDAATETLAKLRELMPADDPFLTQEVPGMLAGAYLARANAEGEKGNYVAALRYAEQGAELAPSNSKLAQAKREFSVRGNVALLEQVFEAPSNLDVEEINKRLNEIQVLNSGSHRDLVARLDKQLADRIASLRESDTDTAAQLKEQGTAIFGDESATAKVPIKADTRPPEVIRNLQSAINNRQLSKAAQLAEQAQADAAASAHSALAGLLSKLDKERTSSEDKLATFSTQADELLASLGEQSRSVGNADYQRFERAAQQARSAYSAARGSWKDRDYTEQKALIARIDEELARVKPKGGAPRPTGEPKIADKGVNPFTEPSPRKCGVALASHGDRLKGVCADLWGRNSKGKDYLGVQMVVVPAPANGAEFAIGKYEFSYGDLWKFCGISGWCSDSFKASLRPLAKSKGDEPVTNLDVNHAELIAQWMTQRTGQTYRLPSATEWEWAANASGEQPSKKDYNCRLVLDGEIVKGHSLMSVKTGSQNGWGLFGYLGNAQEWVVTGGSTAVRGGSYQTTFSKCSTDLDDAHNGKSDGATGFRFVREM